MADAEIGLIGLGVMGSNLALNIAEKGNRIAVFNRTTAKTRTFYEEAGPLKDMIVPCDTIEALAAAIRPPRPVIIMVQAGAAVDEQIAHLRGVLSANDIMIDAGNANFRDTMRRFKELEGSGLTFIGMGVSGGEEGARHGPSIMVGGTEASWKRVEKVLTAISAKYDGEPCAAWLGTDGAGHFVKTIHNGIEYADMQMIAEIYGILRDGLGMAPKEIGAGLRQMEQGPAQFLPDRDHRQGAGGRRSEDRQADGRHHPRPRRPEGHRQMVGDRGAAARHSGDRDRSGRRRARAVVAEGRAHRRREGLRHGPAYAISPATGTRCSPTSNSRCLPARSPPMRKALP